MFNAFLRDPHVPSGRAGNFRVAENDAQDVIEVMRDPACQGPQGLHFLGLAQLGLQAFLALFRLLALGDVHHETVPDDAAIRIALRQRPAFDPPQAFRRMQVAIDVMPRLGTTGGLGHRGVDPLQVFRMDVGGPRSDVLGQGLKGNAEQVLDGWRREGHARGSVRAEPEGVDHAGHAGGDLGELILEADPPPKFFFLPFEMGDVLSQTQHAGLAVDLDQLR